jgi:hypothetical protein
MSRTLQFALLGTVGTVYIALTCYFFLRGWRSDAIELAALLPALVLGILADRRGRWGCGCNWRRRKPAAEG